MTTSHRPTWMPSKGAPEETNQYFVPSMSFSAKDLPGHLTLKHRRTQILTPEGYKTSFLSSSSKNQKAPELTFSQIEPQLKKKFKKDAEWIAEEDRDDSQFCRSDFQEQSEDEDQILLQEYERVKKQREEDQRVRKQQKELEIEQNGRSLLLKGESLMSGYSLEKKWYEDTVFRNQAQPQLKKQQEYINDNVRSQFHRKFLHRFIMR